MQVLDVNPESPEKDVIEKAAKILQLGGMVVYPTETVYGLGVNVIDEMAVRKIFEVKGRDARKPISVAFRDLDQAAKYVEFTDESRRLAEMFMPGSLTMILPAKVPLGDMFGGEKTAVRIPSNKVFQELAKSIKFPITATSANVSGNQEPTLVKHVVEQIGDKVDLIIDAGETKFSKPSTVVDFTGREPVVVREGVVPKERIKEFYHR